MTAPQLNDAKELRIARELLCQRRILIFTRDELSKGVKKVKNKKAPRKDGFSPMFVKMVVEVAPAHMIRLYNQLLLVLSFINEWKEANPRFNREGEAELSFWPICFLTVFGKLYERLINEKILEEIEPNGE